VLNSGAAAPWTYDLNHLDLAINRSGDTEVDGYTFIEKGVSAYYQAYKWAITNTGDTADSY
jgi:hypothetical protein